MMRRVNTLLIMLLMAIGMANAEEKMAYVLTLDDEVNAKMWHNTRRALDEAASQGADLLVVHIDTYGGAVDSADSIRTALLRLDIPTVAFVDHNAASAGALIALACDTVYMSPGSSMGASSVVNQNGEVMPQKYQSYMKSIMRATAESHGKYFSEADSAWHWRRDPVIAESMVDPDRATTFTPAEAVAAGYAEGVAGSVDEVIRIHVDDGKYDTRSFEPTVTDGILGFLANGAVRAILIMLILAGIYMEMHTPGLGFAAAVSVVAAVLYFLPMFVSGTMASWVVILFIIGLILFALEVFVIPGFGVAGVCGIAAILASIVGGMLNSSSLAGEYTSDIVSAFAITAIGVVLSVALIWYLTSRYGPAWVRRVSELQTTQKISEGYIGVDLSESRFVGQEATAATDMRPSGKILIDGDEHDAVSITGYIDAGRKVKIVKFENAQLYVKPVEIRI